MGQSLSSGAIYQSKAWTELIDHVKSSGGALHFLGLLSDGNVHSHMDHLLSMLKAAKAEGIRPGILPHSAGWPGCSGNFRTHLCRKAGTGIGSTE